MKYFSLSVFLAVLVVILGMVQGKKITRCGSGIGGNMWDGKATGNCGSKLGFYCYNYSLNQYCETLDDAREQQMRQCCEQEGRRGIKSQEI